MFAIGSAGEKGTILGWFNIVGTRCNRAATDIFD